jgi:uroporphyrinogen-III decarboxylase
VKKATHTCRYEAVTGIPKEIVEKFHLTFPEAYLQSFTMVQIAKAKKASEGTPFCVLPFCHTVEAEAYGACIQYGDEKNGPRGGAYICKDFERWKQLPPMDLSAGRIHEVLLACQKLTQQGEVVLLQVSGPFTIWSLLMDSTKVFRALYKEPERMHKLYAKMKEDLLCYVSEASKYGVTFFSYADPLANEEILGPKRAKQVAREFTIPFLQEVRQSLEEKQMLLLCPKIMNTLTQCEECVVQEEGVGFGESYAQVCISKLGKSKIASGGCIHTKKCSDEMIWKEVAIE